MHHICNECGFFPTSHSFIKSMYTYTTKRPEKSGWPFFQNMGPAELRNILQCASFSNFLEKLIPGSYKTNFPLLFKPHTLLSCIHQSSVFLTIMITLFRYRPLSAALSFRFVTTSFFISTYLSYIRLKLSCTSLLHNITFSVLSWAPCTLRCRSGAPQWVSLYTALYHWGIGLDEKFPREKSKHRVPSSCIKISKRTYRFWLSSDQSTIDTSLWHCTSACILCVAFSSHTA